MTFQQLNYVIAIADYGSIGRAAEKMFVSQSAVSFALHELEKEFNIKLFTRSSGNFNTVLTEEGRHFLPFARSIMERSTALEEFYSGKNHEPDTVLSISSQHYQCASAACITALNQLDQNEYCITYKECGMGNVIDDVYTFRADLGVIITSNRTEKLTNFYLNKRGLSFETMVTIQPCAFLSKQHPLAKKRVLKISDMLDYPYITFSHSQDMPIDFSEGISKLRIQRSPRSIITNDRAAMVNFLCNSDCISTGSGLLMKDISDDRLISIPLEDSMEHMVLGYIKQKNQQISEMGQIFLDNLKSTLEKSKEYTKEIWDKCWQENDSISE
jgi:DNA-binding transcriptional LysR family regulator